MIILVILYHFLNIFFLLNFFISVTLFLDSIDERFEINEYQISQITESVSELKSLIRESPKGYQKQRLTMLCLYRRCQVKTRQQAAGMIGVHGKTVGDWLVTYMTPEGTQNSETISITETNKK